MTRTDLPTRVLLYSAVGLFALAVLIVMVGCLRGEQTESSPQVPHQAPGFEVDVDMNRPAHPPKRVSSGKPRTTKTVAPRVTKPRVVR